MIKKCQISKWKVRGCTALFDSKKEALICEKKRKCKHSESKVKYRVYCRGCTNGIEKYCSFCNFSLQVELISNEGISSLNLEELYIYLEETKLGVKENQLEKMQKEKN